MPCLADRSMKQIRFLQPIAVALLLATGSSPVHAQTGMVQQINPDADRLAQEMRVLAADPRDVRALLEAGNLSARLGDTAAALAFFARAEAIDPSNPRILAGRASTLVRMERPGEALRLFQTAEARGLPARDYAADRGFAYDLLGQPGLAQADYKLALQGERDDETVRRYALSLGISGNVEEAMRQLDPLLRKTDRAAWRARAFILAMNNDMPGAERIATSMMPGNMGHSLAPFFRRLANLAPADRAFAVHFGQLSPTAARLADARMAPSLPRYVAPSRPVQLAQAQPQPQTQTARPAATQNNERDRRSRRQRERDARAIVPPATRTPTPAPAAPVRTAAADPLPGPPSLARAPAPMVQPLPAPRAEEIDTPIRERAAPVEVARRETPPARNLVTAPGQGGPAAVVAGDTAAPATRPETPASASTPTSTPTSTNVAAAPERPAAETLPATARPSQESGNVTPANAAAARPEPAPPGPARIGQEDSVLAAIVAGITIPGEELQIVSAQPVELPPEPARVAATPPPAPRPEPAKSRPEPARVEPAKPDLKAKKAEPAKPDLKAKKPDPKAKDPAKAEPKRVWVQVAGGANEASLPKAWKAVVARAPAAFRGRPGWWMPLRATNRVVTGPFKTAGEAQTFVNALGKSGVSAFVVTSEAGQKVTKLAD